jgi:hypothetical protein
MAGRSTHPCLSGRVGRGHPLWNYCDLRRCGDLDGEALGSHGHPSLGDQCIWLGWHLCTGDSPDIGGTPWVSNSGVHSKWCDRHCRGGRCLEPCSRADCAIRTLTFDSTEGWLALAIALLAAYSGSNHLLRSLHDLDIQDKHHSLVPNETAITAPRIGVKLDANGGPIGFADGNVELELVDPTEAPTVKFVFPQDSAFPGEVVVDVLWQLHALVSEIIDNFARQTPAVGVSAMAALQCHRRPGRLGPSLGKSRKYLRDILTVG